MVGLKWPPMTSTVAKSLNTPYTVWCKNYLNDLEVIRKVLLPLKFNFYAMQ